MEALPETGSRDAKKEGHFTLPDNFKISELGLIGSCCAVWRDYRRYDPLLTSFGHIGWLGGHVIAVRDFIISS
jgi:hypothetical protein